MQEQAKVQLSLQYYLLYYQYSCSTCIRGDTRDRTTRADMHHVIIIIKGRKNPRSCGAVPLRGTVVS